MQSSGLGKLNEMYRLNGGSSMNLMLEYERLKAKYWDPKNPTSKLVFKDPAICIRFDFGIVDDNQDPDKKGRLKVRFPHWGAVTTNWIPLVRPYATKDAGVWMLPDVGTQVICAFFNDCASRPVVLGSVFTPRTKPPLDTNEDNNLKVLTTKSGSKIIFDDKDGEEKLIVQTKDAKMRIVLDKAKGLSVVNEEGDIRIIPEKLRFVGYKAFLTFCHGLDLISFDTVAIDGTKFRQIMN